MASTGKRNGDNEGDCLKMKFMEKPPHFFKVILDRTLQEGKLRIPKKFARKYGKSMRSPVLLNVPGGVLWQVELKNSDGAVWLEDGWKEFAERYSISCGHFLVFRYEGNDQFHVVIFDKSASEIEYPYNCRKFPGPNEGKTEGDNSLDFPNNLSASRKARQRSSVPCPMPLKMMRIDSSNKAKRNSITETSVPDFRSNSQPSREAQLENNRRNGNSSFIRQEVGGEFKDLVSKNGSSTSQAAEAASKFVSNYPFFKVVIQASNFVNGCMNIPVAFWRKYMKQRESMVTLEIGDESWPVKLLRYSHHNNWKFSAGWSGFCKENDLQAGDICVFELIRRRNPLLKVSIFPRFVAV